MDRTTNLVREYLTDNKTSMTDPLDTPNTEGDRDAAPKLSHAAVGRLSLYYRELQNLIDNGTSRVSSTELGKLVDVSSALVRRDLCSLGAVGRRGVGYETTKLIDQIGSVLGSSQHWRVILIGVGSLGDALLKYRGFQRFGFDVVAAFDQDPARVDQVISGVQIHDVETLEQMISKLRPALAILTVPADQAGEIASRLAGCDIHGILNFAPTTLKLSRQIAVVNVDLASELQRLVFSVQRPS